MKIALPPAQPGGLSKIPAAQRAYLAWHLRTLLLDADLAAVARGSDTSPPEEWREFVRGELLRLVESLEAARAPRGGG